MVAALYVALTLLSETLGMANYPIQVRLSEALCVMPIYSAAAVPGLFCGCLIANLIMSSPWQDIVFGSLATLLGAGGAYLLGLASKRGVKFCKWLASVPNIIFNTLTVPLVLCYAYEITEPGLAVMFLTVGVGEIVSSGVIGTMLIPMLDKIMKRIK